MKLYDALRATLAQPTACVQQEETSLSEEDLIGKTTSAKIMDVIFDGCNI